MNLYWRLLALLLKLPFINTSDELKWTQTFRVLPSDCDINIHLTNSRYFAFADLGRTYGMIKFGLFKHLIKNKWAAVVNAQEITFIKQIPPFAKFTLETELIYWDEKYWYIEQKFLLNSKVAAIAKFRGVYLEKGKVIPSSKVLAAKGISLEQPPLTDKILKWKEMLDQKKQESLALQKS
ncbi:thioesterase family protein [Sediminitomix flava]|uniref:Acyl-CoA thioesterase FadM n=1 Tax=Sediminitomix flava TaxID=379075 RepID=A0A315ZHW8_SEDFL|nr:thioesterase family protein [Sediminitomix flava]PWJ44813.1 acyl-CoA thioesterase FadM [Sediminitomix flava]